MNNYGLVVSIQELESFVERIISSGVTFGFDIETGYHGPPREKFALHPETAIVAGISFTNSLTWARYAPLEHDYAENLDTTEAAFLFWKLLQTGKGVAHNAGFERRHLARWFRTHLSEDPRVGEEVRASNGYFPVFSDTQIEAYLVAEHHNAQLRAAYGLKFLTKAMFDHTMTELPDLFPGLAKNQVKNLRFNTLDLTPAVVEYACEDALYCLAIHQRYYPRVKDMFLYKVEMGVLEYVCEMEDFGVRYDWAMMRRGKDALAAFREKFNAEIMTELSEMIGGPVAISLASPIKVAEILYHKLGMKTNVFTATTRDLPRAERKMSTGRIALTGLAKEYPVVKKILQWKEMKRLEGTYLEKYEKAYNYAADGRTHPNHLQAVVITGRFAVADPPYQQCVPGSYQVLTPNGWERLDKLADGVPVAQYADWGGDREGGITFVTPEVVRTPYHGDMIEFRSSEGGNWRYTPNHRIAYRLRRRPKAARKAMSEIRFATAEQWERDLLRQDRSKQGLRLHDRYMERGGWHWGGVLLTEEERASLRLAVAVQADGSRSWQKYDISVYRDRKVVALRELGLDLKRQSRGRWRVQVPVSSVERWLDDNKDFRAEAILNLRFDELRFFVREVMQWDGDSTRGCTYGQKNSRRQSVDVVQAAAALAGHGTSLYERPGQDSVTVNVHRHPHKGFGWQEVVRVPSEGMVYCVTVPTGMFLCRNEEGKVIVTGNSPRKYHFDLVAGAEAHRRHADAHGPKCDCDDPEFQPPKGTCFQFNFRDAICAPPDHYILGFDFSQAELRAVAGEANETALLKAFNDGVDVHVLTASLMLGIPPDQVTKAHRDIGKTLAFALLYGMSVQGLADRLGIPVEQAHALRELYFSAYPNIAIWSERQVIEGKANGYVTSKFGRRLPIWEFKSQDSWIYSKGERACVNYPIQGAATGDLVKTAMVRVRKVLKERGLLDKVHLVMNIHDALEFYVHRDVQPQDLIPLLQEAVCFPVSGWPAMKADWHIGKRWGSPREIEIRSDGSLVIHGETDIEIGGPVMEEDEETGEQVPVFPEVDLEALDLITKAPRRRTDYVLPRTVIVTIAEMPTNEVYSRFVDLVDSIEGKNTVVLNTPEGELTVAHASGLDLRDQADVAFVLGQARISYDRASVDSSAVLSGIDL